MVHRSPITHHGSRDVFPRHHPDIGMHSIKRSGSSCSGNDCSGSKGTKTQSLPIILGVVYVSPQRSFKDLPAGLTRIHSGFRVWWLSSFCSPCIAGMSSNYGARMPTTSTVPSISVWPTSKHPPPPTARRRTTTTRRRRTWTWRKSPAV